MFHPRSFRHLLLWGAACALVAGSAAPQDDLRPRTGDRESMDRSTRGAGKQDPPPGAFASWGESKKLDKRKKDDAEARHEWWLMRFGGELSTEFMDRVMREAERQRDLYPDQFRPEGYAPTVVPEGTPLPVALAASTWTNLGPTSSNKIQNGVTLTHVNSGRLRTILPDPTSANTLYVLTSGGGLWKTSNLTDATPTWRSLTDKVGSCMGGAAAFGRPVSGAYSTLHLGLGDAFDNGVGGFYIRSTDSGSTWGSAIQLTGTIGPTTYTATRVLDVKVDSSGATDVILVGTDVGLFRSTDGGGSFSIVNSALLNGRKVWSLVKTSAGWLASTQTVATPALGNLAYSTDLGATWAATTTQLPASTLSIPGTDPAIAAGRITLGVGAQGDSTVYAFAAYSNTTNGALGAIYNDYAQYDLFYSTNGGQNWTATHLTVPSTGGVDKTPTNPNPDQTDLDLMAGQAFYNHMILVDPTDATRNTVYLGGQLSSVYSTNAKAAAFGSTWRILTNWLPGGFAGAPPAGTTGVPYAHADFHCAAFTNAGGTERLMFGNDGGLAIGTNRAGNWNTWDHSKNKGIVSHLVYAMASSPLNNCDANSVLMGLQDNGTHNRIGATGVFDQTKGGDGFGVGWSQANNGTALGTYVYNDIDRSTNNPPDDLAKWSAFITGLPGTPGSDGDYYFVTPIITPSAAADATGTVFFSYSGPSGFGSGSASNRIFKSGAASWSVIARADGTNTPGLTTGRYVRPVSHGVGVHPTDLNRLAAAGSGGILMITTNGGAAWTERNLSGMPSSGGRTWQGFNASATWVDNTTLYACSESTAANSIHVARSLDGGATWAARDTGLPDLPVVKMVVDPGDSNTLYAATWLGVYRTTDAGATWSLFGSGLPQAFVSDLYLHPTGAFLRASIYGRGVWQVGPTPTYAAPSITGNPTGGAFTVGTPFVLTGSATSGYPATTYQWKRNGVALANGGTEVISGATTASLTVTNPTCGSVGDYTLVASTCAGAAVSSAATMTTTSTPAVITTHPANLRFANSSNLTLSVVATGTGLTYQWRRNSVNLTNAAPYSGVTTATLTCTNLPGTQAGTFDCVVTNSGGCSITSNPAVLTNGSTSAPNIVTNPVNATVTAPNSTSFSMMAGGGRVGGNVTLNFQWRRNGINLTHGTGGYAWLNTSTGTATTSNGTANLTVNNTTGTASSVLSINPSAESMNASVYDCVVTNSAGTATSGGGRLTVLAQYTPATAVSLTASASSPVSRSGAGWPVTFTAAGSGSTLVSNGNPSPASAYQYQFWVYLDDALGWTMVQDYSTTATYVLPSTTPPGNYGVGVNCRTSSLVPWNVFNAIDFYDVVPIRIEGPYELLKPPSRPPFQGGTTSVTVLPDTGHGNRVLQGERR